MATMVCQGLQSCLESQILEPRITRLKLPCFFDEKECHYDDSHCWSFLKAISNKLESTNKETTTYVHPLDTNHSKSTLSEKSLELCTENLGSETGTDLFEDDSSCGIFSSPIPENGGNSISPRQKCDMKKVTAASARNFPPPLTTICGVASLQVRPHREDGRLIIKATKAPSTQYCSLFQALRSHGRLRLSLFKDSDEDEEEGDVVKEEYYGYVGEEEEEVNGNNGDVGGEMGIKKFQKPGRCKEGEPEKGLSNWEALWVATS